MILRGRAQKDVFPFVLEKKVAVESKQNGKNVRFSTHAEFTSDFQVASAAMRFFRNASKKRERPKRCVEKCGSRVQKTKKIM